MNSIDKIKFAPTLIKRWTNFVKVQVQYRLATRVVRGYPYVLILDTINSCNLHCPLCPTGLGMDGRPKGRMDIDLFKRIIDELGDYAFVAVLHNWGEPMLHPDIFDMVSYARQKRIKTILSSNLNVFDEKKARRMVESGLDELVVSLDGATAETYRKYRIGGEFDVVINNMKLLLKVREDMGADTPKIIWQYLVFKHNVDEVDEARTMARRIGVDDIDVYAAYLGGPDQTPYIGAANTSELAARWLQSDSRYVGRFDYSGTPDYLSKQRCYFLWQTVTINWDGGVAPCCCVFEPSTDFGNIRNESFRGIWNNKMYRTARGLFKKRGHTDGARTICRPCKVFKKPTIKETKTEI